MWCSLSWGEIESMITTTHCTSSPASSSSLPDIYARISCDESRTSDDEDVKLVSPVTSARSISPLEELLLQPTYLHTANTTTTTSQNGKQESKLLSARRRTETTRYTKYGWRKETRPGNDKLFWYIHKSGRCVGSLKKVMDIIREVRRKK